MVVEEWGWMAMDDSGRTKVEGNGWWWKNEGGGGEWWRVGS